MNVAPISTGAIVRAKNYISGGPAECGQPAGGDFWQDGAPAYGCGFQVDPRRVDKYGRGCSGCSPQSCICGGSCSGKRNIDDAFDDLCISRPLDHLYADQDARAAPPLQNTKLSYAYSLRPGYANTESEQNIYKSTQGDYAVVSQVRTIVGP